MWIVKDGNQTKQKKVYDIYSKNEIKIIGSILEWDQGFKPFVIHWIFLIRFLKISFFSN